MAEVRPFRGVRYNQWLVKDLSSVLCPPYDIITPEMERELRHRSEYNFVRLEYGRHLPAEASTGDRYARMAATLEEWLKEGVLKLDEVPAIYLHDHYFMHQGRQYRRRGIIASVRLEEWDKMVVRPHEGTLGEPKGDRLSLLWALQANTSSILALFEDRGQQVSSLLAREEQNQPILSLSSAAEENHNIWAITEPDIINQIGANLAQKPLYIADGHHRYESALTYRRERQAYSVVASGDGEFNFVMMTLVDFADPGLIILSPHRLVRGVSKATLSELRAKLELLFEIDELALNMPGVWQQVDDLLMESTNGVRCILFGLSPECLLVLRLRNLSTADQMMPYFHSELYKRLGVSIIDHVILEEMLGLGSGGEEISLTFSYDKMDAINRVLEEEYQLAFLLSPIKAEVVKAIADSGDRMPRKSTYFYPKPPAGLVFRRLL